MIGDNIITKRFKRSPKKKEAHLFNEEFYKRVEKKAYELFESKGCQHGNDWGDWFEAEKIIRAGSK